MFFALFYFVGVAVFIRGRSVRDVFKDYFVWEVGTALLRGRC